MLQTMKWKAKTNRRMPKKMSKLRKNPNREPAETSSSEIIVRVDLILIIAIVKGIAAGKR